MLELDLRECNECFEVLPANHNYFYVVKGRRTKVRGKCRACCREINRENRKSRTVNGTKTPKNTEDAKSIANSIGLTFLSDEYRRTNDRYDFECSCGNTFTTTYTSVRQGQRCRECVLETVRERSYNGIEWLRNIFESGGNELLDTEYRGVSHKYRFICDCGNIHTITPYSYKDGNRCKECGRRKISGENNPMWNPDLSEEDRNGSRNYPEYIKWREKVKNNYDYLCFYCGNAGEVVHHIVPYSASKEMRTEEDNGVLLCQQCHEMVHKNIPLEEMDYGSFISFGEYMFPTSIDREVDYEHEIGEVCYDTIIS